VAEHDKKGLGEQALDGLSRLGMLGLLLAVPTAAAWAVKRVLQRRSR
jgi:flagellar biogenesis protein FliO